MKYLVRNLTLIDEGETTNLSLHYVDLYQDELKLAPFDKERAGYSYIEKLILKKTNGKWEIMP